MTAPAPARPGARSRRGWSGARATTAAALVVACAFGTALLDRVFVDTAHGQLVDEATRDGARGSGHVVVMQTAKAVLEVVSGATLGLALLAVVAIALLQRRVRQAVAAAVVLAGSTATTQALKRVLLDRPDLSGAGGTWPSGNSLPSGHTTFAASVSAALLLAVPARLRPVAALAGAGWTAATGAATLLLHWHRASDVVAAVLVVGAWTAVAVLLVPGGTGGRGGTDGPEGAGRGGDRAGGVGARAAAAALLLGSLAAAAVALPALAAVWLHTPPGLLGSLGLRVALVGGAAGAVSSCCAVMAAQLLLVGSATPQRAGSVT